MVQPPQHVVGAIAAEPEIDRLVWFEILLPHRSPDAFEVVGDRVSDHQEVDLALAHLTDLPGLARKPPFLEAGLRGDRGIPAVLLRRGPVEATKRNGRDARHHWMETGSFHHEPGAEPASPP